MNHVAKISVAPMMDWTDRHCRYFHRLLNPTALLYTEMIHANAVVKGDRDYLLSFDPSEHPVAVQLGGNDPQQLALAAKICADFGYDQINLNVGCPSDRVQEGAFGACLMKQPERVAACVQAMKVAVSIPVTVKTRIGVDELDNFEFLDTFVKHQAAVGVDFLVVHARIAILSGLSPKQNRSIPPLNYDRVRRLRDKYDQLPIVLNGGITTVEDIEQGLAEFTGVMIGRAAYHDPWILRQTAGNDKDEMNATLRSDILSEFVDYVARQLEQGVSLQSMTRHILGLYSGQPGARGWRRYLSENSHLSGATEQVILDAMAVVDRHSDMTYNRAL